MSTVLVMDTVGDSRDAIERAAADAGWTVAAAEEGACDAIVLVTNASELEPALGRIARARAAGAAVVLVADVSRADWPAVFGSRGAPDVDAILVPPVDAPAIVQRLQGILSARQAAHLPAGEEMATIVKRAIVNEESAAGFYRQAAQRVSDPVTREALEGLMRDEFEHKRLIEEFRSGKRPLPTGHVDSGTIVESLGTPDFTPDISPADAFLLAARKEKLAVEFYENWAALYAPGPEHELLIGLAEIERRHKRKVEDMFTNAAFPEAW